MDNPARAQQAVRAWQEHLITENEALEIVGADNPEELFAAGELVEANDESTGY